ncbi:aldose epimerase family protein [Exiguobacterium acetylicum]|uniref:aldose epimerase family protein n=1 Tax=Exiguobacterium acetylicum TaxID=41170 RepID=UPI001EE37F29|nr:aldose epimerase family protein [Exiguobacterium acetylicum]UKS56468.1 galactose mutarotase [Exiguobacterium acetylicum]
MTQLLEKELIRHTLRQDGIEVTLWNYGGIIQDIRTTDRDGHLESVVLGLETVKDYQQHSPYFGAIVGRVAGRIGQARFEVAGDVYPLAANDGDNHLHGGIHGFDQAWFEVVEATDTLFHLRLASPDGAEGYPGTVTLDVYYRLEGTTLMLEMTAVTNQTTPLNLTNHTYFNLSGNAKRDVLDHILTLPSDLYLPVQSDGLPTGEQRDVSGTPFDFRSGQSIRDGVTLEHPETIAVGNGYDHPFILREDTLRLVDPVSGRFVDVTTNQPAVVVYTGTQLLTDYTIHGFPARPSLGLCLETQVHPNAVHEPDFPSILLSPGETYHWKTAYRFGVVS